MILSKPDIIRRLNEDGGFDVDPPPDDTRIGPVSIDLRLGRKFATFKGLPNHFPHVSITPSLFKSRDLWCHEEKDSFVIKPGAFVLGQTLERVTMPRDLMGLVEGRSSWARAGISVHLTAPKIDPGFTGNIALELANMGRIPVYLNAETDEAAQLILLRVTETLDESDAYGGRKSDNFQYQSSPIPGD